ncbi:MAG: hypothetical protein UY01_C0006G0042 [Candidatus Nomurabacteria bacterium GW2011_GWB1_47_6]|uniref:Uncharacterized protein n=1 Tax=Candidatus Nomurabacteria bacterium GW2011_GWB1_47_6 TaxID=1618749 RepID=A0A0G1VC43_9BACT|nr:MAG: hypothetical protein UY01_C0006G0042 [Candidatus Nomurabacteria bacterium GW2011_GWB1_47_6]
MNRIMVMLFVVLSSAATLNLHAMQTSDPRISNEKALALINMDPQDPAGMSESAIQVIGHLGPPQKIFSLLLFLGATMHPLWGDEAETALFARNILRYGVPKGWDGVNIMGINNAAVLDKHLLNHSSPWGQYYLVAASFALFGESCDHRHSFFIGEHILWSARCGYKLIGKCSNETTHHL